MTNLPNGVLLHSNDRSLSRLVITDGRHLTADEKIMLDQQQTIEVQKARIDELTAEVNQLRPQV